MKAGGSGGSSENQNQHQHNISQTLTAPTANPNKSRKRDSSSRGGGDICNRESHDSQDDEENQERGGGCGDEVWQSFSDGFRQVQSVLDRNRTLIQLVNENHLSKNADNMLKNVTLIQEINANISKIRNLYSDLSSDFSTFFHHRAASDKSD